LKKIVLSVLMLFAFISTHAQYKLDSVIKVATGVVYKRYTTPNVKRNIFVLEVSLNQPDIKLQVVKSSGVIDGEAQTVSAMYMAHNNKIHKVLAGVNADFFTSTLPCKNPRNMLIGDGEILWDTTRKQTVFAITEGNKPFIGKLKESYTITNPVGKSYAFNQINRERGTDQMVMYNHFKGIYTNTSDAGTEIKIIPVAGTGGWKANAIVRCKVLAKQTGKGNMRFASGQAVLSGNGAAADFLRTIKAGDVITLDLNVIDQTQGLTSIRQLSGGDPRLVTDGANYAVKGMAEEGSPRGKSPEPRTGIGYNSDKSKLYIAVIDGRENGVSEGFTLTDFADFMMYLGCYQALNLDGGGSSDIVVNGILKNRPSDGNERLISSAILIYQDQTKNPKAAK